MANELQKLYDQNNLQNKLVVGDIFQDWKEKEKGTDADTILISYYDSLLLNSGKKYTALDLSAIRDRRDELAQVALKHKWEKRLNDKWWLVAVFDPKHPAKKAIPEKSYTFFYDHTVYICEKNEMLRDSFKIKTGDHSLVLECFPQAKDFSFKDDLMQPFRFSGDTLIISECQWPADCKTEFYLRK
jgi:hypothetical protein